jgi:hypothetical protein
VDGALVLKVLLIKMKIVNSQAKTLLLGMRDLAHNKTVNMIIIDRTKNNNITP